jgi:Cys-tRNA(Pro) deacylase
MSRHEYPVTQGIRTLRGLGIPFKPCLYAYEEHGGAAVAAKSLGVPEHEVIKTLVFCTDTGRSFLVLMHGDLEVSPKRLAREMGVRHVELCDAETAQKHTGYVFGGTSPLGTRSPLPVLAERTIFDLPSILINAGKQGFLVRLDPKDLKKAVSIREVEVSPGPQ